MELAPTHPLLEVKQEEMERVRMNLGLDREKIRKNLDAIAEWAEKEKHLTDAFKYIDGNFLERLHIVEKGSVERTKIRIDRLLTTKGLLSEICLNKCIDEFEESARKINFLSLPKLHPKDLSRVSITRVTENGNDYNMLTYLRNVFLCIDYSMHFEYDLGERYILDFKHLNMTGLANFNPFLLKKGESLAVEGYGLRIKGVHIVNATTFVDTVVALIKKAVREKVANRIFVHDSLEDLQKEIPKEILPEEYGGDLPSGTVLLDQWMTTLKTAEARKIIECTNKLVSDDSKRNSYKFNEEYLGMPGSFNQLVVD